MKTILAAFALIGAFWGLYGRDPIFEFTPEVRNRVVQVGSPLEIRISWKCPEGYEPKAWRLIAYVPNIPSDFARITGNKVTPHKMAEWSSVFIMDWIWKIPADGVLVKKTGNWPVGDYKMALYIIFQTRDKNNKIQSKMISRNILFSLRRQGGKR